MMETNEDNSHCSYKWETLGAPNDEMLSITELTPAVNTETSPPIAKSPKKSQSQKSHRISQSGTHPPKAPNKPSPHDPIRRSPSPTPQPTKPNCSSLENPATNSDYKPTRKKPITINDKETFLLTRDKILYTHRASLIRFGRWGLLSLFHSHGRYTSIQPKDPPS